MVNEYWAEWITPSGNNRHNLLKDEIVQYLNIDKSNIDHLETFISPKKIPFTSSGLASVDHPLYFGVGPLFTPRSRGWVGRFSP